MKYHRNLERAWLQKADLISNPASACYFCHVKWGKFLNMSYFVMWLSLVFLRFE